MVEVSIKIPSIYNNKTPLSKNRSLTPFEQLANQVVTEHNLIAQMSQLGPRESINDDGELEESKLRVSTVNPILSEQMRS